MVLKYSYRTHGARLVMTIESEGTLIWQVRFPSFYEDVETGDLIPDKTLMELGVMTDLNDVDGLKEYLTDIETIHRDDVLLMGDCKDLKDAKPTDEEKEIVSNAAAGQAGKLLVKPYEQVDFETWGQRLRVRLGSGIVVPGDVHRLIEILDKYPDAVFRRVDFDDQVIYYFQKSVAC